MSNFFSPQTVENYTNGSTRSKKKTTRHIHNLTKQKHYNQ